MEKEIIKIAGETLHNFDIYREGDFFEYNGERYTYFAKHRTDGDGEWYRIVVKRKSDNKLFAYDYGYGDTKNFYEDNLFEVKEKSNKTYE